MRKISKIFIHCTATQPDTKPASILNYWRNTLGWKNPGYHFLIDRFGTVHKLHPMDKVANGVKGYNREAIHISYIGGVDPQGIPKDTRTEAQRNSLISTIHVALQYAYENGGQIAEIYGHRDYNPAKACPSFNAKRELGWLKDEFIEMLGLNAEVLSEI